MKTGLSDKMSVVMLVVLIIRLFSLGSSPANAEEAAADPNHVQSVTVITIQDANETAFSKGANQQMILDLPKEVVGFSDNELKVRVWEDGEIELRICGRDGTCRYRSLYPVRGGRNIMVWNGAGAFGQPLTKGDYTVEAIFTGYDGAQAEAQGECKLVQNLQSLLYAVPSSDVLYLNDSENWSVDCSLAQNGNVVMDIFSSDAQGTLLARVSQNVKKMSAVRLTWNGRTSTGRFVSNGRYCVSVYAESKPDQAIKMTLYVEDNSRETYSVGVTGPVVPQRDMTDSEIWSVMMQPSVVYLGTEAAYLRESPSLKGTRVGKINPQKQALEVLAIEDDWAKVRAWSEDDGSPIEGYLQKSHLGVVLPDRHYALLIDVQKQTMTVYEYGKQLATIPVSTGLATSMQPNWTTPAGSFITGNRLDAGGTAGKTYECRISYDGNRVIEQVGFQSPKGFPVYVDAASLGQKAIRGSIAVPVSADEALNAWWLYTHLRTGTRVVIIDEEPALLARVYAETEEKTEEGTAAIVLTVCGDAEVGNAEYEEQASGTFEEFKRLFQEDDLTIVSLASVLVDDDHRVQFERHDALKTSSQYTEILMASGIEAVSVANRHFSDYQYFGRISTLEALKKAGLGMIGAGSVFTFEKDGHRIGILADREKSFAENPELVAQDIAVLRQAGCEVVIALCSWGNEGANWHTELQESMAMHLAAAGADLIIGQSGGMQGIDQISGVPVIWNLGKMLDREEHPVSLYSMMARITLSFTQNGYQGAEIELVPYALSTRAGLGINDYHPSAADQEEADILTRIVQTYSGIDLHSAMWFQAREEETK